MDVNNKQISRRISTHLLFAKEREMEQDLEGFGISSQDDKLRDTTVQGLGS
jgi:hypothetical protein